MRALSISVIAATLVAGVGQAGAKYPQDKYHARVLVSAADWDLAEQLAGQHPEAGLPSRDMVVTDGQMLTLGGTKVHMHIERPACCR
jgi:hypothetical protein